MKIVKKSLAIILMLALPLTSLGCNSTSNSTEEKDKTELIISAAASLKEAMADIETAFEKENPTINLTFNFGSSGSLEQQINNGAPCDVFISAGESQMNSLDDKGLLLEGSNYDLLKNSLVLVGPKGAEKIGLSNLTDSSIKHIAMGEPSSVPAGKYADEVLTKLGLKESLKSKLVFAKDVKEVLAWVSSGNADVGFIYKTDALSSNLVEIFEPIEDNLHSSITYPVGIVKDSKYPSESMIFENFLFTDECIDIFEEYGYKKATLFEYRTGL